jgi:predicted nucleic acid-binding protein
MPDEKSQISNDFFETISERSFLYVPALFWFEISNLLSSAIMKKRVILPDINQLLELIPQSKFNTDLSFGTVYANSITILASEYSLSSYDAAYLELAIRKEAIVGTLDNKLLRACAKANVLTI